MRILVVYFSRTGRTRRLARNLAHELGASEMRITERRSRKGFFGYQRSLFEAVTGRDGVIDSPRLRARDFDLVLIGTPIWGWHLSSPVRAYARQQASKIRRAAFFCTMGGSGDKAAFAELSAILGRQPVGMLALTENEVDRLDDPAMKSKIEHFARRLGPPPELRQAA